MTQEENKKFPGFPPKPSTNFWSYPKDLNEYWHQLSGSEQKVLDYILRHTWGFNKTADEISLGQLERGIKGFDSGTGLSKPTIIKSIKGLVKKGFILKEMGKKANCYALVKNFNYHSKKSLPIDSKNNLYTIKNNAIKNKQYNKKPYFWNKPMWKDNNGKWWVIHGQNDFREFNEKENKIEWR